MRVGLLADIHANAGALDAVLRAAQRESVDELLIAGDFVGYYYAAGDVLSMLGDWNWHGVRGNHEDLLSVWRAGDRQEEIVESWGSGLKKAAEDLATSELNFLCELPHPLNIVVGGKSVVLCHGSPWNIDAYIYPDAEATVKALYATIDADLVVAGHTRYPDRWTAGEVSIVNPGSVGQPRDRRPGACWTLWDTVTNEIEFRRETYDTAPLSAACRRMDPHLPYLADVLTRVA